MLEEWYSFFFLFQVDLPTPNFWLGGPRNNKSIWNGLTYPKQPLVFEKCALSRQRTQSVH